MVQELCDDTLHNYLCSKNISEIEWKYIFVQVLLYLHVIQRKFPGFKHNDLKTNNILIKKRQNQNAKICIYEVGNKKIYLPLKHYQIKVGDYDFSSIHGLLNNLRLQKFRGKNIDMEQN